MKLRAFSTVFFIALIFKMAGAQVLIGPVVGPQVSWVAFDDKDEARKYKQKPVYGFHAGAGISFRVQKRFFLNAAMLYSLKGKHLTIKGDDSFDHNVRYRYIEMPISYTAEFVTKTGTSKQFKWYLGLGPNVSYLLNAKGTLKTASLDEILVHQVNYHFVYDKEGQIADNEMNIKEPNRLQLGLNLTAGLAFEPLGLNKIMITMRYEFGHSFFTRGTEKGRLNQDSDYADDFRVRNQGFRLSAAYFIDLKTDQRKKGKSTISPKRRMK